MFANPMVVCKLRSKFTLDRLTEFFNLEDPGTADTSTLDVRGDYGHS